MPVYTVFLHTKIYICNAHNALTVYLLYTCSHIYILYKMDSFEIINSKNELQACFN